MRITRVMVLLIIFIIPLVGGCVFTEQQHPYIDLNHLEPRNNWGEKSERAPFRVSLAAITSTKESMAYYEELLDLLALTLDRPVELVQRNTYAEVNELLRTGEIDLAFICTYAYVDGHDRFALELVAVPEKDGQGTYRSYIITRQNNGIDTFEQLKDKRFVFTDPMSATGYIYPLSLLKQQQMRPEEFFTGYSFTYSHDNSIRAVLEGIADGAAVESMVYAYMVQLYPEIGEKISIIQESDEFAAPPVVMRPTLKPEIKEQLKNFFYKLDSTEAGKRILAKMGLDGYRPVQDSAYNSVRALGVSVE